MTSYVNFINMNPDESYLNLFFSSPLGVWWHEELWIFLRFSVSLDAFVGVDSIVVFLEIWVVLKNLWAHSDKSIKEEDSPEVSPGKISKRIFLFSKSLGELCKNWNDFSLDGFIFDGFEIIFPDDWNVSIAQVFDDTPELEDSDLIDVVLAEKVAISALASGILGKSQAFGKDNFSVLDVWDAWSPGLKSWLVLSEPFIFLKVLNLFKWHLEVREQKSDWMSKTLDTPVADSEFAVCHFC